MLCSYDLSLRPEGGLFEGLLSELNTQARPPAKVNIAAPAGFLITLVTPATVVHTAVFNEKAESAAVSLVLRVESRTGLFIDF